MTFQSENFADTNQLTSNMQNTTFLLQPIHFTLVEMIDLVEKLPA